jgi:phosphocarrier protein
MKQWKRRKGQGMVSVDLTINNKVGLHARPATLFSKEAQKYASSIFVNYQGNKANGKSMLEVMGLGIGCGAEFTLTATGDDEVIALEGLKSLVGSNFGESE